MKTITRFEVMVSHWLTYFFSGGCVVLSWLVFVKLDAAKFEVIEAVKSETGELKNAHLVLQEKLDTLDTEFTKRGEWIQATDAELTKRTVDRIYRSEFLRWAEDAKRLNPDLVIPELEAIGATAIE